jgi:hypothetical protein
MYGLKPVPFMPARTRQSGVSFSVRLKPCPYYKTNAGPRSIRIVNAILAQGRPFFWGVIFVPPLQGGRTFWVAYPQRFTLG